MKDPSVLNTTRTVICPDLSPLDLIYWFVFQRMDRSSKSTGKYAIFTGSLNSEDHFRSTQSLKPYETTVDLAVGKYPSFRRIVARIANLRYIGQRSPTERAFGNFVNLRLCKFVKHTSKGAFLPSVNTFSARGHRFDHFISKIWV